MRNCSLDRHRYGVTSGNCEWRPQGIRGGGTSWNCEGGGPQGIVRWVGPQGIVRWGTSGNCEVGGPHGIVNNGFIRSLG